MKTTLKYLLLFSSLILSLTIKAQKKVVPVTQSALSGIALPEGSKQDKRFLSEAAAAVLLGSESKKANTGVKNPEVLYLPPVSTSKFDSDSLVAQLSAQGWELIPMEDEKYVWLQKNGRYLIAYFLMEAKQSQLYFAEAEYAPTLSKGTDN